MCRLSCYIITLLAKVLTKDMTVTPNLSSSPWPLFPDPWLEIVKLESVLPSPGSM